MQLPDEIWYTIGKLVIDELPSCNFAPEFPTLVDSESTLDEIADEAWEDVTVQQATRRKAGPGRRTRGRVRRKASTPAEVVRGRKWAAVQPAITRVCRFFRRELLPYFYGHKFELWPLISVKARPRRATGRIPDAWDLVPPRNVFVAADFHVDGEILVSRPEECAAMRPWLRAIGPANRAHLRGLYLSFELHKFVVGSARERWDRFLVGERGAKLLRDVMGYFRPFWALDEFEGVVIEHMEDYTLLTEESRTSKSTLRTYTISFQGN